MKKWFNSKNFKNASTILFIIIAGILFYQFLNNFGTIFNNTKLAFGMVTKVLTPLLYGMLFAFLMSPGVNFFEEKIHSIASKDDTKDIKPAYRTIAILLVYLVLFGFIFFSVQYMIPKFFSNLVELFNNMPLYIAKTEDLLITLQETMDYASKYIPQSDLDDIFNMLQPPKLSTELISSVIGRIFSSALSFTSVAFNVIMGCVIAFYLLKQKEDFAKGSTKLTYAIFSENTSDKLIAIAKEGNYTFKRFFIGKALDSLIIGIMCFIGLSLMQNRYALLLSLIIGVTNMIPYFGPFIGGIPAVLITLFDGFLPALFVAIFVLALQQFDGLYLGPKILGDSIGISPFWIIISILIGGALWGPLGMFFGAPVCAVILSVATQWVDKRLEDKNICLDSLVEDSIEEISAEK
ncbi:MAG: AI-2E family transporter [Epulopiscium sp.]|nr:AI-2E family transporter [Candidatus Epulonipiscium sp.]